MIASLICWLWAEQLLLKTELLPTSSATRQPKTGRIRPRLDAGFLITRHGIPMPKHCKRLSSVKRKSYFLWLSILSVLLNQQPDVSSLHPFIGPGIQGDSHCAKTVSVTKRPLLTPSDTVNSASKLHVENDWVTKKESASLAAAMRDIWSVIARYLSAVFEKHKANNTNGLQEAALWGERLY